MNRPVESSDIASWNMFLPTVRVGGALPVTFRPDGDYVLVEMIVPYVPPPPQPLMDSTKIPLAIAEGFPVPLTTRIPLAIAEGFPVPLTTRYRLPAFSPGNATDFIRHVVRELYHHEIDEQLRVDGDRPFAPKH